MFAHKKIVAAKKAEREDRLNTVSSDYQGPITPAEKTILNLEASEVISKVQSGDVSAATVLHAYGKQTIAAQNHCNPVTEVMFGAPDRYADKLAAKAKSGPLAGFPVSLKDTANVPGYDSCMGYSALAFKPAKTKGAIIQILEDAGAVPFVKTNVPLTLLSFESYNDVWGNTENPHVAGYSSGGSTGGEAALLAYGGSRLGVGTDVAGSVRVPAHYSGIYSLKCTSGRFPKAGNNTSMPGQDGIPAVYSPMCRTLADLSFFTKVIIDMKPWNYDYTVTPLPWKEPELPAKLKIGLMATDTITPLSPACERALSMATEALRKQGHEIIEFVPPRAADALNIGTKLLTSDALKTCSKNIMWGGSNDNFVAYAKRWYSLPKFLKKIYVWWVRYVRKDPIWATLADAAELTGSEFWQYVYQRETYKAEFYSKYKESGIDYLITAPAATPAYPCYTGWSANAACLYTFLFNIVDYPAGIMPVTHVDKDKDQYPETFSLKKLNGVAKGVHRYYDPVKMHGLPVGVQVVGRRFDEEGVLAVMQKIYNGLEQMGQSYELLNA
ncbi:hypothetical protein CANCADRAFT_124420 [Tortispora caseinolytica NRRL Y-17796]|uniref:amidase n=1 Tax=Tortispora caseinolytica NRRL Y-17796 TaxID=767744 RepID=A0A1E4T9X5_9ASCO|nr:hypothetical protein CANCADRAFT_124420 [Tortispora caseinolytica NRRL Y-17796]